MISLYDILTTANGQLFGEPAAQIFTEFCLTPQMVTPNSLFVALRSEQGDTHRLMAEAVERGTAGIMCMTPPDFDVSGITVILVRDSIDSLMAWSTAVLKKFKTRVIAVAGSTGKTSTIETIRRVLSLRYRVLSGTGHEANDRLSLPLALAHLKPEHEFMVVRLGATQPGELAVMAGAAQPETLVLTSVHHSFLDAFNSVDQYAGELQQIARGLDKQHLVVLNNDDNTLRVLNTGLKARTASMGIENFGADIMAYNLIVGLDGTGFDLRFHGERYLGRWTPLLGKHQLYSVLSALLVGVQYGIDLDEALRSLSEMEALPGRMHPFIGLNDSLVIDDSGSANPESTLAALDWLASVKDGSQRAIFVMGDMDHLGPHSAIGHRNIGRRAAAVVDMLITEGSEAAAVGRAALDNGMEPRCIRSTFSRQDTIHTLTQHQLTPDDIVLVKGGPSMKMSQVVLELLKYPSDQQNLTAAGSPADVGLAAQPTYPTWVEINTDHLAGNVRALKQMVGDRVELMAVIKADGYGHGAITVARTALLNGASYLAVANIQEALNLREAGIQAPILILSYTPIYAARQAIQQNLTVTVYDLEFARAIDRTAREIGTKLRVHVKIDTGMGRLGVLPDDAVTLFRHLGAMQYIEVEGVYTHFSVADEDPEYTASQIDLFKKVLRPLRAAGFNFKHVHAANSAAALNHPESYFNMVRTGIALYGLSPSANLPMPDGFQPVMSWKTVVAQVKTLPRGHYVGYGNTYRTRMDERIAVLPVGYADGLRRSSHWDEVLIRGQRVPIRGRISMEKTIISVDHIPDVVIGDEVVLIGQQGNEQISADEIARKLETINYEIVTSIAPRVPRR
jgi:Alr-MurF fusion protein